MNYKWNVLHLSKATKYNENINHASLLFFAEFYMCFGSDLCLAGQRRGRNFLIRNKIRFNCKNFTNNY